MLRLSIQARQALAKLTLPVLFAASFGIVLLGKVDALLADRARVSLGDALAPLYAAMAVPAEKIGAAASFLTELWHLRADNEVLRTENDRLRQWQSVASALEAENHRLKADLHWVPTPTAAFITAKVVADAGGVYARAALLSVGPNHFVRRGMVVLDERGLVGRITDVGARSARALLLTDLNSRVPVVLESTRARAVMVGTNGPRPRLLYWSDGAPPKEGEHLVTSGEGGVLPPDLPVGTVRYSADHVPQVIPDALIDKLEVVRVFDFQLQDDLTPAKASASTPANRRG